EPPAGRLLCQIHRRLASLPRPRVIGDQDELKRPILASISDGLGEGLGVGDFLRIGANDELRVVRASRDKEQGTRKKKNRPAKSASYHAFFLFRSPGFSVAWLSPGPEGSAHRARRCRVTPRAARRGDWSPARAG